MTNKGNFSIGLPLTLTRYANTSTDKRLFLSATFDSYPISSFLDPIIQWQVGFENIGISARDAIATKLSLLNSITQKDFLFQQSLNIDYFNFTRGSSADLNIGLNLDLYYYLPTRISTALRLGYSFEKEITSPVELSNITINKYSLGLEVYY